MFEAAQGTAPAGEDGALDLAHGESDKRRRRAAGVAEHRLQHFEFGAAGEAAAVAEPGGEPVGVVLAHIAAGVAVLGHDFAGDIGDQGDEFRVVAGLRAERDQAGEIGAVGRALAIDRPAQSRRVRRTRRRHHRHFTLHAALERGAQHGAADLPQR